MKKYISIIIIMLLMVVLVFSQITIRTQIETINIQNQTIEIQKRNIENLTNGVKEVVAKHIETEIVFCELIDKYRAMMKLPNENYAKKMRAIRDEFPHLKPSTERTPQ